MKKEFQLKEITIVSLKENQGRVCGQLHDSSYIWIPLTDMEKALLHIHSKNAYLQIVLMEKEK